MKTSHFLSNYDFSGRPLIQGLTSSGTIHHQPAHDRNHLFQSVDNCDNDVTITSTYTNTVNSGDNHQQNDYNHSTSTSNHQSSTILYGESENNEYNVIRSTNNKYQHKETAKRKRETGKSNFFVNLTYNYFFLNFWQKKNRETNCFVRIAYITTHFCYSASAHYSLFNSLTLLTFTICSKELEKQRSVTFTCIVMYVTKFFII